MDPDIQSEPEQEGYVIGYSCFEELPPVEVFAVEEKVVKDVNLWPDKEIGIPEFECTLMVPKGKLHHLQMKDVNRICFLHSIADKEGQRNSTKIS